MIMQTYTVIALVTLAALFLNIPFGYLRVKAKKFTFMWFLYIHLPIPFIFLLRTFAGLGIGYVPIIAFGAILGQFIGGRLGGLNRNKA